MNELRLDLSFTTRKVYIHILKLNKIVIVHLLGSQKWGCGGHKKGGMMIAIFEEVNILVTWFGMIDFLYLFRFAKDDHSIEPGIES